MKRFVTYLALFLSFVVSANAQDYIEMRKEASGIYTLPCEVNGLKLRFIFDTGASAVSISLTEASFMLKNGYLDEEDILGTTNVRTADGNIAENITVNLKQVKIGSVCLKNIKAVVSNGLDAPLLLGQSVLDQLGHWSINNSTLILNEFPSSNGNSGYTFEQLEEMLKTDQKDIALDILRKLIQEEDDDYASYLFLYSFPIDSDSYALSRDPDVVKAMSILESTTSKGETDTYHNYDRIIWFSLYRLHDKDKALKYFRKIESMKILSVSACDELAYNIMLASGYGLGSSIDDSIAKDFYSKGYYKAYVTYSSYLKDVKKKPILAFNGFKKCADKGSTEATYELAMCYINGIGTKKNIQTGISLLKKATDEGWIDAISELCSIYYYGNIVKKDFDKVLGYARLFGEDPFQQLLFKGYTGIAYWGQKKYRMALQYLEYVINYKEDKANMSQWVAAFNKGLNAIYSEMLYALGQSYENGLGGNIDFEKAFDYYNKMIEFDPAWAYGLLGDMFFLNEFIKSDYERAYKYYLLGANNGNSYCYYRLSLMTYYGVGTYQNTSKAMEYKKEAIKLGESSSDFPF